MLKIKNCQEVEVSIINTAQQNFFFGNEFILRGARKINAIEVFSATQIPYTPTGAAVIAQNLLENAYLTLIGEENNREIISQMPLSSLLAANNNGNVREFDMPMINPSKCYIRFGNNTGLVANSVIVFAFYYEQ